MAAIKNSEYAQLASDLEINKAVMFLKQNQLGEAIDTLKAFEKDSDIALNAATNLSFIYYLVSHFELVSLHDVFLLLVFKSARLSPFSFKELIT